MSIQKTFSQINKHLEILSSENSLNFRHTPKIVLFEEKLLADDPEEEKVNIYVFLSRIEWEFLLCKILN